MNAKMPKRALKYQYERKRCQSERKPRHRHTALSMWSATIDALLPDGEFGDGFQQVDVCGVLVRRAEVGQLLCELVADALLF